MSSAANSLFVTGILVPDMIADLHWSKAQFAALGGLSLITAFFFPIAGRLGDLLGVWRTALIGIVALPLSYLAFSFMTGPIWQFAAIQLAMGILTITTATLIYCRVAVRYVQKARGIALAIVASGPAVTGMIVAPLMNRFVEAHGWRASYQILALYVAIGGMITLWLLPRDRPEPAISGAPRREARKDYPLIFRSKAFWILLGAMMLCNLPNIIVLSQLKMILIGLGIPAANTSVMLTSLPLGLLAGRFVIGYCLDRYPSHLVGAFGLALPCIGLFIFASGSSEPWLLTFATICLGFALGAEGDIISFVSARKFGVAVFSSVMGLLTMVISFSVALGSGLLGLSLKLTGGYTAYLYGCSMAVLLGGSLIFLLRLCPDPQASDQPDQS